MQEVWNEHKTVAIVTYRSSKLKRLVWNGMEWNGMEWNKMREMSTVAISAAAMISSKSCLATHVNSCSSPNHTSS
jgi:hypothetical protein